MTSLARGAFTAQPVYASWAKPSTFIVDLCKLCTFGARFCSSAAASAGDRQPASREDLRAPTGKVCLIFARRLLQNACFVRAPSANVFLRLLLLVGASGSQPRSGLRRNRENVWFILLLNSSATQYTPVKCRKGKPRLYFTKKIINFEADRCLTRNRAGDRRAESSCDSDLQPEIGRQRMEVSTTAGLIRCFHPKSYHFSSNFSF